MSRLILLTVIFFFVKTIAAQSEQKKIDSLTVELSKKTDPFKRIEILFDLFEYCRIEDNLKYTLPAIKEIDKLILSVKDSTIIKDLLAKKAKALQYSGVYYTIPAVNDHKTAIRYYTQALNIYKQLNSWEGIVDITTYIEASYARSGDLYMQHRTLKDALGYATAKNNKIGRAKYIYNLAIFFIRMNDTLNGTKYADQGILLEKEINDPNRIARGYFLGGGFYVKIDAKKALSYYNEALKQYTLRNDSNMIANVLIGIGEAYAELKNYPKAKEILIKALNYADTTSEGGFNDLNVYYELGKLEYDNKFLQNAIRYHKIVYEKSNAKGFLGGISSSNYYLAKEYFALKEYKKAKDHAEGSLSIMKQIGAGDKMLDSEELCYKIDSALGNYNSALIHHIQFMEWKDKLSSASLKQTVLKEDMKAEMEKSKREQEQKDEKVQSDKRKQLFITLFVAVILIIVSGFLLFVFRSLRVTRKQKQLIESKERETQQQKHLIEEKQSEILDSISYAKRLQNAILPPHEFIRKYLPDNFLLYKPKDIVAGDFYWAEQIENLFFIAAADSTGHGVPGAMVSVICSNALNRSVKEFKLTDTDKILDKTRKLVVETFEKSSEDVKDGMDISLLCIDMQNQKVFWSGANNPLWYIQDGELKTIKADKQPIGKTEFPKPFTAHQIEYKAGTIFYLFTDGLADQFGGPKGKKFKYKQFEDLLVSINMKPMSEQSDIIYHNIEDWKGDLEQVDDICVIGIKL